MTYPQLGNHGSLSWILAGSYENRRVVLSSRHCSSTTLELVRGDAIGASSSREEGRRASSQRRPRRNSPNQLSSRHLTLRCLEQVQPNGRGRTHFPQPCARSKSAAFHLTAKALPKGSPRISHHAQLPTRSDLQGLRRQAPLRAPARSSCSPVRRRGLFLDWTDRSTCTA